MDDRRFDEWTRALVVGPATRRTTFRILAGGVLGSLVSLLGLNEAAACRGFRDPCKETSQCCSGHGFRCRRGKCLCGRTKKHCSATGNCIPKAGCCTGATCSGGMICPQPGEPCCIPQGTDDSSICNGIDDTRCCPGSVCREINIDNEFRCRPEGCVEKGQPCPGGAGPCCSLTCGGVVPVCQ
jgi:hypothetical protein